MNGDDVGTRARAILGRIAAAAVRAGRDPGSVTLVAASKTQPVDALRAALAAGVPVLGENRVQEAEPKIAALTGGVAGGVVRWHFIGRLQRNKARRAVELFELIHSLDSLRLAEVLDRLGQERGAPVPALVEVNLGGEDSKGGFEPGDLPEALRRMDGLPGLAVRGLMTIPPPVDDPEASRPHFRRLRDLAGGVAALGLSRVTMAELSMGMSDDYEVAVEEGATFVRVGTALFGARPYVSN